MMSLMQPLLFIILTLPFTSGMEGSQPCDSPQIIEFGKTDIISCSFEENVFLLIWYNSTDIANDEPLLYYRERLKSGNGYLTGEYDISSNGSLIIKQVSLEHDHYFTVVMTKSASESIIPYTVRVVVTVTPKGSFPVIDKCGNLSQFCFQQVGGGEEITCSIHGVRPQIYLKWITRTAKGDQDIPFEMTSSSSDGIRYSISASATYFKSTIQEIALFVCKSERSFPHLSYTESVLLVQSDYQRNISQIPVLKFIEHKSQFQLTCNTLNATFWIWKHRQKNDSQSETTLGAFIALNNTKLNLTQGYSLDDEGSLVGRSSSIHQEGMYICSYGDGVDFGNEVFNVIVYVPPIPAHPVVDGCEHQETCVLEKQYEDYLTCRLLGIRPTVDLGWNVLPTHFSSKITFSNEVREVISKGNTFDVSITSKYHVNDASQERLTIECRALRTDKIPLKLASNFDLFFLKGDHVVRESEKPSTETRLESANIYQYGWFYPSVVIALSFGLLLVALTIMKARRNKCLKKRNKEEMSSMLSMSATSEPLSAKKKLFIAQLKGTYEDMYSSVQPVPFIREKIFSVNDVFVESGLELLHPVDGNIGKESWSRLRSYSDIFKNQQLGSLRYIIEGGPGYGKSTFALQLAYDWSNGAKYTRSFGVFIFLRLRHMGEKVPISKAIKNLLLPEDSLLTEDDVMGILRSYSSVLFVLDGYDEYPDFETDDITDVKKIINRDIFQGSKVILTTRCGCLPTKYSSQTKRIRLTGFDDQSRENYVSKVVSRNNVTDCKMLKACLQENPVLGDLCQIPLFFVMFAHITIERREIENFTSVTSFFRYIIFCIQGHLLNKSRSDPNQHVSSDHNKIDISRLNEEAFRSLNSQNRRDKWIKADFQKIIGQSCYDHYAKSGILISESVLNIFQKGGALDFEHIQYTEEVRFYHRLFCEWYAAHYLSNLAANCSLDDVNKLLKGYNPLELQYLFRFACGLKSEASGNIIKYLNLTKVPDQVIMLCIIEQTGDMDSIIDSIKDLCSRAIEIRKSLSKMMLRSTKQLLAMASSKKISISCLRFWDCFVSNGDVIGELHPEPGALRPKLEDITCIEIYETEKTLSEENTVDILKYLSTCMELKTVKFFDCLLPYSLVWRVMIHFEVLWYTVQGEWFALDMPCGSWKNYDSSDFEAESASRMTRAKYDQLTSECQMNWVPTRF